jgi:hypothetical protein
MGNSDDSNLLFSLIFFENRYCSFFIGSHLAVHCTNVGVTVRHEVARVFVMTLYEYMTWCSATSTLPGRATGATLWCEALGTMKPQTERNGGQTVRRSRDCQPQSSRELGSDGMVNKREPL